MCGISGITGRTPGRDLTTTIRRMNNAMSHRGPDADGFFEEDGVAFGHRRLAIIDLSSAANQPFKDVSERYVMVFNGEIYNFADIKRDLPEYPFRTNSDTEVVIAAYIKWGKDCLQRLKGMFALAIWDRVEHSLFLARDRFGVKPLYYYKNDDSLLFASEIRAILASGLVPRKINRGALMDYLKYQSVNSPYTLVQDVFQLFAGTWMKFKDGVTEQGTWWDITKQKEDIGTTDPGEIHRKIKDLLYRSVERRLISDVPLGAFLSGGIDSSAVVAIMSQVNKAATNAFTIAFEEKDYNELPFAEMVARKFGVNHSKVLLRPRDFLEKLPDALNAMDTPSGDGLNTYVVSQAIRKNGITVALSGIGGDELFAGYPLFGQFQAVNKWKRTFEYTRGLRKGFASLLPGSDQRRAKWKGVLGADSSGIADIYPLLRQIQSPHAIRKIAPDLRTFAANMTLDDQLKDKRSRIGQFDDLSQVSIADYLGYTQSVLLKDADQMGMAASLEIREPFFDHDLVEYVLNVPDEIKNPAFPKKLLIDSLGNLLPDEVVYRKKQGFVLPYDIWMRTELRSFCEERIQRLAARSFFSGKTLINHWNDFVGKKANIRPTDVWIFIVLEHWLEKNDITE